MPRMVALLRGINLGARNRVPMPALREHLAELGYEEVATVAQSGNVVLTTAAGAPELAADLQRAVAERFGVDTPVIVRTRAQIARVVRDNPLPEAEADPKRFQVYFCRDRAPAVTPGREPVAVRGREIYAWHDQGIQRSDLASRLTDAKLGTVVTARNWNTVRKLHELLA